MDADETAAPGLRERFRETVQTTIAVAALRLFQEQGFEATTIDQIASAAGISRRSFFRYFSTKEDVVLGHLVQRGLAVQAALEARPASEPPWDAIRAAFAALAEDLADTQELTLKNSKMLFETPSLRAGHIEKQLRWQDLLVPNIERRLGIVSGPVPDPRAQAIVASALACLHTATEIWTLRNGEGTLEQIFDEAVAAVRS